MRHVQRVLVAMMLLGLVLVLLASFRPWGASGSRERSSYALVAVADRLGFITPGLFTVLARSWFAVPLAVAVAVGLVLSNRILAAVAVASIVGCGAMAMAQTVERSPLLALDAVAVGRFGGMMAVLAGVATVLLLPSVTSRKEFNERSDPYAAVELGRAHGTNASTAVGPAAGRC